MEDCIFCKIAAGEIPAKIVYRDEEHTAFLDIQPAAPAHAVLVPNKHYPTLYDVPDAETHGRLMLAACAAARAMGLGERGFRIVANYGPDGGQEVMHVHYHILGGRTLHWPPG